MCLVRCSIMAFIGFLGLHKLFNMQYSIVMAKWDIQGAKYKLQHRLAQTKSSQGMKPLCPVKKASALPLNGSIRSHTMRDWIQIKEPWSPLMHLCTGQLHLSLHLQKTTSKKPFFLLFLWCSEEHAFSASSEFRGDFRWVARPHSLITRSKTPAELQAAPSGIKTPSALASSGPTC